MQTGVLRVIAHRFLVRLWTLRWSVLPYDSPLSLPLPHTLSPLLLLPLPLLSLFSLSLSLSLFFSLFLFLSLSLHLVIVDDCG
jgi:hypothetical protein